MLLRLARSGVGEAQRLLDARRAHTRPLLVGTGTSELLSRETDDDGAERFYDYDSVGDRRGQQVTTSTGDRYRAYTKDANGSVLGLEDDTGAVATDERYAWRVATEPAARCWSSTLTDSS